jgi:hypothetical protein
MHGVTTLAEFFSMWHVLANFQLASKREDEFVCRWLAGGFFSVSSAYRAFFAGMVRALAASQIWWSQVPYPCKFFV